MELTAVSTTQCDELKVVFTGMKQDLHAYDSISATCGTCSHVMYTMKHKTAVSCAKQFPIAWNIHNGGCLYKRINLSEFPEPGEEPPAPARCAKYTPQMIAPPPTSVTGVTGSCRMSAEKNTVTTGFR